jgi:hypothetical protein
MANMVWLFQSRRSRKREFQRHRAARGRLHFANRASLKRNESNSVASLQIAAGVSEDIAPALLRHTCRDF